MKRKLVTIIGVLILGLSLVAMSCAPTAEKPADFYKGKTIDFVVATTAGSDTDVVGRLVAEYIDKYAGTTSAVTNRRGAGGSEGVVWIYRAQPDGVTLGTVMFLPLVLNKIMEAPGTDYEFGQFRYLLGLGGEPYVFYVAAEGPYQSIADLQATKDLKFCGTSLRGSISLSSMSVVHMLGLDAKVITGYKFSTIALAAVQGEIDGFGLSVAGGMPMVEAGQMKPLFVLGNNRSGAFPDVPALTELVSLSGEEKELNEVWDGLRESFPYFTPPGVPEDRVTFLREVGDKIMADPEFRSKIDKVVGYKNEVYFTGEEMSKRGTDLANRSDEFKSIFAKIADLYATQ